MLKDDRDNGGGRRLAARNVFGAIDDDDDVGWRRRCASYGVIDNRSENLQLAPTQCRALSPDFPAGARGLYPLARG